MIHARGLVLAALAVVGCRHEAKPKPVEPIAHAAEVAPCIADEVGNMRVPTLLERACQGGDGAGCGAPATASETFY